MSLSECIENTIRAMNGVGAIASKHREVFFKNISKIDDVKRINVSFWERRYARLQKRLQNLLRRQEKLGQGDEFHDALEYFD